MDQNENLGNRQATTNHFLYIYIYSTWWLICATRFVHDPNLELHQERVCPPSPVPKTTQGSNDQKPDKGSASPSRLDISESPSDSPLSCTPPAHLRASHTAVKTFQQSCTFRCSNGLITALVYLTNNDGKYCCALLPVYTI
jgi:hypothetical protein